MVEGKDRSSHRPLGFRGASVETESQEIQVTLVCAEDGVPDALWRAKGSGQEMILCQLWM